MTEPLPYDLQEHSPRRSRTVYLISLILIIFLFWSAFASVDKIVRGEGQVVSSSRAQIVQNLEGGILSEILVQQGDIVRTGQILGKLQDTKFRATSDELREKIDALEIRKYRLEAEIEGQSEFDVPSDLLGRAPEIFSSEKALLTARQNDFNGRLESAKKFLHQLEDELDNIKNLYQSKIVAQIEVNTAQKDVIEAAAICNEIKTQYELKIAEEYSETLLTLASMRNELRLAEDQLNRTFIKAPMPGIVNSVTVTTIGGVVQPGEEIFEIIPLGEELFVEARIKPKDIASVKPGQDAAIKLSAYDYTIYGALSGSVEFVSADTFEDAKSPSTDQFYRVTVKVDLSSLTERQHSVEIRPGMNATAELKTGTQTVLSYLLKPLYKSREAFREP